MKLTWFKFTPADWFMGRIQRLPLEAQAEFIRLCCVYWNKECSMTVEDAKLEIDTFEQLVKNRIVKVDGEEVFIDFLDAQIDNANSVSEKRRKAAKARWNKSKAKAKQTDASALQTDAEKKREDKRRKEKTRQDKKREDKNVVFPFDSEDFSTWWSHWLEYKAAEHKFKFKSQVSEQAAVNKLVKLSDGREDIAIQIIQQSIENGWKGFFQLKTEHNEQKGNGGFNRQQLDDFVNNG